MNKLILTAFLALGITLGSSQSASADRIKSIWSFGDEVEECADSLIENNYLFADHYTIQHQPAEREYWIISQATEFDFEMTIVFIASANRSTYMTFKIDLEQCVAYQFWQGQGRGER